MAEKRRLKHARRQLENIDGIVVQERIDSSDNIVIDSSSSSSESSEEDIIPECDPDWDRSSKDEDSEEEEEEVVVVHSWQNASSRFKQDLQKYHVPAEQFEEKKENVSEHHLQEVNQRIRLDRPLTMSTLDSIQTSLDSTAALMGRDNLTQTQNVRLQIQLVNLREIQQKLIQIIQEFALEEYIRDNLLSVLDRINSAIDLGLESEHSGNSDGNDENNVDHHQASEYQNALALSQFLLPEDDEQTRADEEFARRLQEEYNLEFREENEEIPFPPPPPPLPKASELGGNFLRLLEQINALRKPEDDEVRAFNHASKVLSDRANQGLINNDTWECNLFKQPTKTEYHLKSVFTIDPFQFYTYPEENTGKIVQYYEVEIEHLFPSFLPPFAFLLWRRFANSQLQFTYGLLDQLTPWSAATVEFQNGKPNILHAAKGKELKQGDTLGVGVLWDGRDYILFITQNGEWAGFTQFTRQSPDCDTFQLVLLTSAAHHTDQMKLKVNGTEDRPFLFNYRIPTEECSICFEDVLCTTMIELERCQHRFCYNCTKQYLENALTEGNVIDTTCPDMNCPSVISDGDILKVLSALQFGKFKQYRALSQLRLDSNCRWCPNVECSQPGVIGNPSHEDFPRLTCPECSLDFCFNCNYAWHAGITCAQAARRRQRNEMRGESRRKKREEKETRVWMRENKTVKCSRCGGLVQRAEGCNHMTCVCGYQFCWLCGESILSNSTFPMHYTTGACAGLQMSSIDELSMPRKVVRGIVTPARYGVILVGLPVYGAVKLVKKIM